MTEEEFIRAWDNHELDAEYDQFQYDNYPDIVTFEHFMEFMIDE